MKNFTYQNGTNQRQEYGYKKTLIPILFMFWFCPGFSSQTNNPATINGGITYYVDVNGNDTNNGISPNTSWKTVSKVNSFQFQAGDEVLFKRGDIWTEQLSPTVSGTSDNPIVFGSYGSGNAPVISGFVRLIDWQYVGSGIWQSDCPSGQIAVNIVTLNGRAQPIGRYPNLDAPNKGYLTIESHTGTSVTSSKLTGSNDWSGAEIVIRKNHWIIDRSTITSQDENTINYKSGSKYVPIDKYGFFIQNDPKTLDEVGEWYFNPSTKKVLMFFGNTDPRNADIEVNTKPILLSINKKSNIVINDISFQGSTDVTISVNGSNNIKINNVTVNFSGTNAITATTTNGFSISNSTIQNTNNDAIQCSYLCSNVTISSNRIKNTGCVPGMGQSGDGTYSAINLRGAGNLIENNQIDSTGYVPIEFQGDANVINNVIYHFAFVKDDGGGIHTGDTNNSIPLKEVRQINGNFIFFGIGAREGAETDRYLPNSNAPWPAVGIYIDDNSKDIDVVGNTTANNNGAGIFIHNAHNINVKNNTIYNNHEQLLMKYDLDLPSGIAQSNTFSNNILVSGGNGKYIADFKSSINGVDVEQMGTFEGNYYINANGHKEISVTSVSLPGSSTTDMSAWKSKYNKSSSSFKKISPSQIQLEYNTTNKPKVVSLNDNYTDYHGNSYTGEVTLQPYSSMVLIKN